VHATVCTFVKSHLLRVISMEDSLNLLVTNVWRESGWEARADGPPILLLEVWPNF
jgi:hypothetical protein